MLIIDINVFYKCVVFYSVNDKIKIFMFYIIRCNLINKKDDLRVWIFRLMMNINMVCIESFIFKVFFLLIWWFDGVM